MKWFSEVVGVREASVPVLIADAATWLRWQGTGEPQVSFDSLEGVVGVVEIDGRVVAPCTSEGQAFEVGVGRTEVVVVHGSHAAVGGEEFLAGELEVVDGLVIGDSWAVGSELTLPVKAKAPVSIGHLVFFVPLKAGRYVVLEGRSEDDEVAWYRILRGKAADHARRPDAASQQASAEKEVAGIMARVSFADERKEARALEEARRLIELGRADLALELCDRASPQRATLANLTRVFALRALGRADAAVLATSLAEAWLAPATAADSVNQVLPRRQLLEALDAVAASDVAAVRARVAAAPEPDVFVSDDGDSF